VARPDHLFVFCYDVARNYQRSKLADLLSEHCDRVQFSVFEGRMTAHAAQRLAARAALHLGLDDSLRVYCVPEAGRALSIIHGNGTLPEADDFVLL
jgi:CRISPR-associated protein Cas2